MLKSESDIIASASALIRCHLTLSEAESALVRDNEASVPDKTIAMLKGAITRGGDPLGEAFCAVRTPETRRKVGAVYTPKRIIDSMVRWTQSERAEPYRIVDPGAGSGRFLMAMARIYPNARLVAIEPDALASLTLRANAEVLGFAHRLDIRSEDYCDTELAVVPGRTLFVGNPPYVRHHDIGKTSKKWFDSATKAANIRASKLAGLHVYFFLKTMQLAKAGDFGAFVTSAEWLDTNYGAALRELLTGQLRMKSLHILNPKIGVFPGTHTTAAITCFHSHADNDSAKVQQVDSIGKLNGLGAGLPKAIDDIKPMKKWSLLVKPQRSCPADHIELGELFRVHRGQVTGANNVWVLDENVFGLDDRYLQPTVTRARELISAEGILADAELLRRVVDLPFDLDSVPTSGRAGIDKFLAWAKSRKANDTFVAKNRKAWWSVGLKSPPPVICTYMARRSPAFVRNQCGARILNIAHGMYPREEIDETTLGKLLAWLRVNVHVDSGRTYSGGLTKFEPKEVERIAIPPLAQIVEMSVT